MITILTEILPEESTSNSISEDSITTEYGQKASKSTVYTCKYV